MKNIKSNTKLCSIIILSYNQMEYTKQCLESIRKYTLHPYEIIIVDNASSKETVSFLCSQNDIILIKNEENKGFAGGCNQGIKAASGDYILLLNNDVIVTKNWLTNMICLLEENEDAVMTGPLTNSTVGKQMIKVPYGEDMAEMQKFAEGISKSDHNPWRTLRLTGFCLLMKKDFIDEIGLLDEKFGIGNYEDDDFCIRALLMNKKFYVCRTAFVHHFMNISFVKNNMPREQIMMQNKLLLEKKWDDMNWNYYSVYNSWLLQKVIDTKGKDILHLGCGVGTLEIELKEYDNTYNLTGVEVHGLRRKIAGSFLDSVYDWNNGEIVNNKLKDKLFDVIIVESMLEKKGFDLFEKLIPLLKKDGKIFVRVFNHKHITTLERMVNGVVSGNLLCAVSPEFCYYFGDNIEYMMQKAYNLKIIDKLDVVKTFTYLQNELFQLFTHYPEFQQETRVYNRIYEMKL